ncbi:MAG: TAXI family TRAP transporter solute-binding subunit [Hyphomicrobiales bacterium]|nr:TAXI family TRAP transporter solute-binding subunit [Hyphomicrobiales bacterium]
MKELLRLLLTAAFLTGAGAPVLAQNILVLGGNPPGSLFYTQAQALAAVITKHTDLKVDVLPQGATTWYPMLGTGEVDLGVVSPVDAYLAYKGISPYDASTGGKGFEMRTVMLGSLNNLGIVAAKDAGIEQMADLKGHNVVVDYGAFVASSLSGYSALAAGEVSPDDVTIVKVGSYPQGVQAVIEGRADAAVGSLGSGVIRELDSARGAKFLSLPNTPEALKRVREVAQGFSLGEVAKGPPGLVENTVMLQYPVTIIGRADLEPEALKAAIKALYEHYEELGPVHPSLKSWTPDRFASTAAVIPYHPAAIEYYREVGLWTPEMDAHQEILLKQ